MVGVGGSQSIVGWGAPVGGQPTAAEPPKRPARQDTRGTRRWAPAITVAVARGVVQVKWKEGRVSWQRKKVRREVGRDARKRTIVGINVTDGDCGFQERVGGHCSSVPDPSQTHVSRLALCVAQIIMENKMRKRKETRRSLSLVRRHPAGLWAIEIGSCIAYLSLIIALSGASFQVDRSTKAYIFPVIIILHDGSYGRPP